MEKVFLVNSEWANWLNEVFPDNNCKEGDEITLTIEKSVDSNLGITDETGADGPGPHPPRKPTEI